VDYFKSVDPLTQMTKYFGVGRVSVDCSCTTYTQAVLSNPTITTGDWRNLFTGSMQEDDLRYRLCEINLCCTECAEIRGEQTLYQSDCKCSPSEWGPRSFRFSTTPNTARLDTVRQLENILSEIEFCKDCD